MELNQFIKQSLVEITEGIMGAKKELKEKYDIEPVAPGFVNRQKAYDVKSIDSVEFDISVSIKESDSSQLEGGTDTGGLIEVIGLSINAGGIKSNAETSEKLHRIQFKIPYIPQAIKEN